jgi:hypothetical protein
MSKPKGALMIDLESIKTTVGDYEVKDLLIESNCGHCSLSNASISGYILVNGTWHRTSWFYNLKNMSGIEKFDLKIE